MCTTNFIVDVPVLGTEPDLALLYSLKSGVRRIFNSAGVLCPPGEHDIYSILQVFKWLYYSFPKNIKPDCFCATVCFLFNDLITYLL